MTQFSDFVKNHLITPVAATHNMDLLTLCVEIVRADSGGRGFIPELSSPKEVKAIFRRFSKELLIAVVDAGLNLRKFHKWNLQESVQTSPQNQLIVISWAIHTLVINILQEEGLNLP